MTDVWVVMNADSECIGVATNLELAVKEVERDIQRHVTYSDLPIALDAPKLEGRSLRCEWLCTIVGKTERTKTSYTYTFHQHWLRT